MSGLWITLMGTLFRACGLWYNRPRSLWAVFWPRYLEKPQVNDGVKTISPLEGTR